VSWRIRLRLLLHISPSDWVNRVGSELYLKRAASLDKQQLIADLFNSLNTEEEVSQAYALLDIPLQLVYARFLTEKGRNEDAGHAYENIVRTFEKNYGSEVGQYPQQLPLSAPKEGFFAYLSSLYALGRSKDAEKLSKAYSSHS
jgi:hypothetical protein